MFIFPFATVIYHKVEIVLSRYLENSNIYIRFLYMYNTDLLQQSLVSFDKICSKYKRVIQVTNIVLWLWFSCCSTSRTQAVCLVCGLASPSWLSLSSLSSSSTWSYSPPTNCLAAVI